MSRLIEQTWEEEIIERERNRANARVEAAVEATERAAELRTLRSTLGSQLAQRFGPLPQHLHERIALADADRLRVALTQVLSLTALDDLSL